MTLEERRNRSDMVEMYKVLKGLSAIPRETFFELIGSGRTTGNSLKIVKIVIQMDIRMFMFSQRVTNRWNALDADGWLQQRRWMPSIRDYMRIKQKKDWYPNGSLTRMTQWPPIRG